MWILQQTNSNISPDPCGNVDVNIKIQLDVNLQASLHVLIEVLKTESCVGILVLTSCWGSRCYRGSASNTLNRFACIAGIRYTTLVAATTRVSGGAWCAARVLARNYRYWILSYSLPVVDILESP
jgi:hypothetical protein